MKGLSFYLISSFLFHMKKHNWLGSILLSFGFLVTMGCATTSTVAEANKWIPADFNSKSTTLLIQPSAGFPKMYENKIKEFYLRKYKIVSLEEIENPQGTFANTDSFRYALENGITTNFKAAGAGSFGSSVKSETDYHFYDRKLKKHLKAYGRVNNGRTIVLSLVLSEVAQHYPKVPN
jgi:hypothetical protein